MRSHNVHFKKYIMSPSSFKSDKHVSDWIVLENYITFNKDYTNAYRHHHPIDDSWKKLLA